MAKFIHRSDQASPGPSARRLFVRGLFATAGAAALALAGAATAQPAGGRMDPRERERLRRDLRERGAQGWPPRDGGRGDGRADRPGDGRGGGAGEPGRGRMSDDDRQQLRRQLREAGRRRN